MQGLNEGLKADPAAYWKELIKAKCNVEKNLTMGIMNNMIRDFKAYDCMQGGKYTVGVGKLIAPTAKFIEHFGIDQVVDNL